jgi:Fe-S-cluster containining protein
MSEPMDDHRTGTGLYRELLERLDRWFADGGALHGGIVPCRSGCASCCYGPFDISVADVELLREAVRRLPASERAEVRERARTALARMEALEPTWRAPHEIAVLGDERFDRMSEALAADACPLLDAAGRCRIYADRPLVCRMIGLGMITPAGRVIENTCPIQERFPGYPELPPVPFDLEELEAIELECLQGAGRRLYGSVAFHDFETTIAAAIADMPPDDGAEC